LALVVKAEQNDGEVISMAKELLDLLPVFHLVQVHCSVLLAAKEYLAASAARQ
jgi:hypothetical protein